MTAAVSFQGWMGSLSDINGGENTYENCSSTKGTWYDYISPAKRVSGILTMPHLLNPQSRCMSYSAITLTPDQYIEFPKFLDLLRNNLHQPTNGDIDRNHDKPSSQVASLLDPISCSDFPEKYNSMLSNHYKFLKTPFCANIERLATAFRNILLLNRSKRRHCNSESDISCCGSITNQSEFSKTKVDSRRSADGPLQEYNNTTLCKSYETFENLSDRPVHKAEILSDIKQDYHDPSKLENVVHSSAPIPLPPGEDDEEEEEEEEEKEEDSGTDMRSIAEVNSNLAADKMYNVQSENFLVEERKHGINSCLYNDSSASRLFKSVSFADDFGLPLTEVFDIGKADTARNTDSEEDVTCGTWPFNRKYQFSGSHYNNEITRSRLKRQKPVILPDALYIDVPPYRSSSSSSSSPSSIQLAECGRSEKWVMDFQQPAAQYYEFRQRVENGSVSLENIAVTQPEPGSRSQFPKISGTIKVKNLSFEKQVWLRVTTDNWQSYADHMTMYDPELSSGYVHSAARFDTFKFRVDVAPQLEATQQSDRIEFAIRYLAGPDGSWGQHWDNNKGQNYVIEKRLFWSPTSLDSGSLPINIDHVPEVESPEAKHQFRPYTSDYRPNFDGIFQFTDYRSWAHFAGETTYY